MIVKHLIGRIVFLSFILCFAAGCVTPNLVTPPQPQLLPGIYHRVEKGQTLWRISRIYNTDLEELVRVNHILDSSRIETGESIFIPNRQKLQTLPPALSLEDFIWPLKGRVIAVYGEAANNMFNQGINIQANRDADVVAARSGKIVFYGTDLKGFGKTIIIDHGDGFSTVYARNTQVFVKAGENVQRGAVISRISSGARDKNTYLHFEIRKGHVSQNPYFYLP